MSQKPRRALILSPEGLERDDVRARPALDALEEGGVELRPQAFKGVSAEILGRAFADADLAVAAGGDGTVRFAAGLVRDSGVPLGVLPLGTANDFARTLGLDGDPLRGAAAIVAGNTRPVDIGLINGEPFLNVASFGLSAAVNRGLEGGRKRLWGPLSYVRSGMAVLLRRREFGVTLRIDGEERHMKAIQVGVANGRFQGGGAVVHPEALLDDGILHVYVVEQRPTLQLLAMALSVKAKAHGWWESVHLFEAHTVDVFTALPLDVSVDGDLIATTPVTCEVAPGALRVFVPEDFAAPGLSPIVDEP